MRPGRVLLLLSIPTLIVACVADPVTGERHLAVVQWTPEEEVEMGRQSAPNIESQFDAICPDAEANQHLYELVEEMVRHSVRREDFDFHFKILNSSIPNAFALPGGFVYITRGLLQELETEAQFISVMGHELGHVEHRHSMLNQSSSRLLSLPTAPLRAIGRRLPVGGRLVSFATALVESPLALAGLKFSRDQELEADQRGVFFAAEMGYDPSDANKTFELFRRLEQQSSGGPSDFSILRTHPLSEDRIEGIEETIKDEYPALVGRPATSFRGSGDRFVAILQRFRERTAAFEVYERAHRQFVGQEAGGPGKQGAVASIDEAIQLLPEEPLFRIAAGEYAIAQEQTDLARQQFLAAQKIYQQQTPGDGHWKPPFYLGLLEIEAGQHQAAVQQLEIARDRYPMNGGIHLFLGEAYEGAGDNGKAIEAYKAAVACLPSDSPLHEEARRRQKDLE